MAGSSWELVLDYNLRNPNYITDEGENLAVLETDLAKEVDRVFAEDGEEPISR